MSLKLTSERSKSLEIVRAPHKESDLQKAGDKIFIPPPALQSYTRIIRPMVREGEGPLDKNKIRELDTLPSLRQGDRNPQDSDLAMAQQLIQSWEQYFKPLPIDVGATIARNLEKLIT